MGHDISRDILPLYISPLCDILEDTDNTFHCEWETRQNVCEGKYTRGGGDGKVISRALT